MASLVFIKRGLILLLQKQTNPPGSGSFVLLLNARILWLFERRIILRPAPGGVADFSCKHKFKMTESLDLWFGFSQFFKMLHLIKVMGSDWSCMYIKAEFNSSDLTSTVCYWTNSNTLLLCGSEKSSLFEVDNSYLSLSLSFCDLMSIFLVLKSALLSVNPREACEGRQIQTTMRNEVLKMQGWNHDWGTRAILVT